jgi:tRNA dimethylallyltransferase
MGEGIRSLLKTNFSDIKDYLKDNRIFLEELSEELTMTKKVLVICGPTCTGKSEIGVVLAKLLDTDIISIDSMQVYRGMNIGTDKHDTNVYDVKQYMTDIFEPDKILSVVEFKSLCDEIIKEKFFSSRRIPLLVGGSGLYIRSIANGIDIVPDENKKIRDRLKKGIKRYGTLHYYLRLKDLDSEYAKKISHNDSRRIIRALEVYELTGLPFSSFQKAWKLKKSFYNSIFIGIEMNREVLYGRINDRVDKMFEKGLVGEVEGLIDKGYGDCRSIKQAVGYKEVLKYIRGDLTLDNCIEEIKKNTRRLAKKQMTWFKSENKINWIRADNYDNIFSLVSDILKIIKNKLRNGIY